MSTPAYECNAAETGDSYFYSDSEDSTFDSDYRTGGEKKGKYRTYYLWENTNKLLGKSGFVGIKTGITNAAGPCLSSCARSDGECLIVILLNSRSMEQRWEEAVKLFYWAVTRIKKFKSTRYITSLSEAFDQQS